MTVWTSGTWLALSNARRRRSTSCLNVLRGLHMLRHATRPATCAVLLVLLSAAAPTFGNEPIGYGHAVDVGLWIWAARR